MTNPYIIHLRSAGSHETFFLHRELRRYEVGAARFREAGVIAFADLFDGYAEQARLEIAALDKVDQRIADLDATLRGEAPEVTLAAKQDAARKLIAYANNPFANAEFAPVREPAKVRA